MKSQPISCTSTGMCGTLCAASTSTRAPTRCAASVISFAGVMVPRTLDMCVSATSLVFALSSSSRSERSSV